MATTKKPTKRTARRKKGSQRPYTRHSAMTTQNVVAAAAGIQLFTKVAANIGPNATEGDLYRRITNTHATLIVQVGETQAAAIGANGFRLAPGQVLPLMGPEGVGWAGDLWIFEATGVAVVSAMSF